MADLETHPLKPFLPTNAKLLMCGTFPPARNRWSMEFYYPNFINDMWRIFGIIFFGDKEALVDKENKTFKLEKIKQLLEREGVALSDTGREIERTKGNAADKFLEIKETINLPEILTHIPDCVAVVTTGEKAAGIIAEITGTALPKMGEFSDCKIADSDGKERSFRHWRMPSSSRAYPMKLEKKAEYYSLLFK